MGEHMQVEQVRYQKSSSCPFVDYDVIRSLLSVVIEGLFGISCMSQPAGAEEIT